MSVRNTQARAVLSELINAVRELETPTWPLVRPEPIRQMEIGLPSSSTIVLWPEENCPERAMVVEKDHAVSLHLNDEFLAPKVSVTRVRRAIAVCRDRIAETRKQATSVLQYFPNDVARLEQELNSLLLLGEEIPDTQNQYRLLFPLAWRIQRLLRFRPDLKTIGRVAASLVTRPTDHAITLTVNTSFSRILYATVRSEYYRISVTLSLEQGVRVYLEDIPVYDPFAKLPRLARVAPDPYQATRVADLLTEIMFRLMGE